MPRTKCSKCKGRGFFRSNREGNNPEAIFCIQCDGFGEVETSIPSQKFVNIPINPIQPETT